VKRDLEQWFFRTTKFADELLSYEGLTWPEPIQAMQTNWIGRSEGGEIVFTVADDEAVPGGDEIRVFTTRPDTLFGATFMVLAPEHPLVDRLTHPDRREQVGAYRFESRRKSEIDRLATDREKTGVPLGSHAINPVNGERVPLFIADYVLLGYGTGAIMAVPAHDERDFAFAQRFGLPIRQVVAPAGAGPAELTEAFVSHTADEHLVNSGAYDGMPADEGGRAIVAGLEAEGKARATVTYRLRDWLISRQRAWGTPIPVVYCPKDGIVPLREEQLPVLLPDVDLRPQGGNALEDQEDFLRATCPRCGGEARRETDTMDTFVDSSWYWWRYLSPGKGDGPIDSELERIWCPVEQYTGGAEHAVLHLLYARWFAKALNELGLVHEREPWTRLFNQGQILGADGERMSKSRGNVQDPDELVSRYGADTVRLFLMFMKPWEADAPWSPTGISGVHRFLNRVWTVTLDPQGTEPGDPDSGRLPGGTSAADAGRELRTLAHRTVKDVTEDYDGLRFNTAVAKLMELTNRLMRLRGTDAARGTDWDESIRLLLLMLAPMAPHAAEELWSRRLAEAGEEWRSIHRESWPAFDASLVTVDALELPVQVNGKLRDRVPMPAGLSETEVEQRVLARDKVQTALAGRDVVRFIHVPDRLVNLVVKG
jgi:leucyl-tRNA synthetase